MHVETKFEQLLEHLVPGCEAHWVGASPKQINKLEAYVGRPLPPFYRWFLTRMGRSMGPLANARRDMSIGTLLDIYRGGFSPPVSRLLLVASEKDDFMPMYMYCDLDSPMRDDALVCSFEKKGGVRQDEFETLRESLAWDIFGGSRIRERQRCTGTFRDHARDVLGKLEPVLDSLGFELLHRTGPRCGLYERGDVALECMVPVGNQNPRYMFFTLAGDETTVHSVLGTIGVETSLEIEIDK